MIRLSNSQSFLWWLVSVVGYSVLGMGLMLVATRPDTDRVGLALYSVVMGTLFGTMWWGIAVMPTKIRENIGWKKFRPVLWWLGIFAALVLIFCLRHNGLSYHPLLPAALISALVTVEGWVIGWLRVHNAKKLFGEPDSV